ncbi:surface polysaccharide O-acyltransferase-like enzyme [Rhizobium sp. BK181]|nr:surface polysaccharide O-acyltransferase-like enzyme [Rhizobium sp. BK181]
MSQLSEIRNQLVKLVAGHVPVLDQMPDFFTFISRKQTIFDQRLQTFFYLVFGIFGHAINATACHTRKRSVVCTRLRAVCFTCSA